MQKRSVFSSVSLHLGIGLILCLFIVIEDTPVKLSGPIEVQLADIHVHQAEVPTNLPQKKEVEKALQTVKTTEELRPTAVQNTEPESATKMQNGTANPSEASWENATPGQRNEYLMTLMRLISAHKYYPKASILNEEEGVVQLKVTLGEGGKIMACELAKTSGFARLDEAAIKTLNDIGSLPLPSGKQSQVTLLIPIRYEIHPAN